jgi:phosphatidylserine/phosphatidylglycerophosphate/cardiolipin synthase-like enzyme
MLAFPGLAHEPGQLIGTNVAPIQKFRWSDYRVYADTEYSYRVHPVYGTAAQPDVQDGPSVTVRAASTRSGDHHVLFNRAAAASQAFSRKFPQVEQAIDAALENDQAPPPLPPQVLEWLSRGVLEQILGVIGEAADATWGIDIAIYEYELPNIVTAVEQAHARGADVRIVYHAKPGDPQTAVNEQNLQGLPAEVKRPRITSKIHHHKFIVLSRIEGGERRPQLVLCGSTNFTENGVYRQGNVVHVVRLPEVAARYLALFEVLFSGETPPQTRKWINQNDPIETDVALFGGFSPRSGAVDLNAFIASIDSAQRDVLFCTAFDLYDPLEEALLGQPRDGILRLGLQNSRSAITGFHRDRTADFVATGLLSRGLDGFLRETTAGQRGHILIHTKLVVVDFTSDAPTVISGSHNLSLSASEGNDENFLILRGNRDVADCYGVEAMRLYDHYRFRWLVQHPESATGAGRPTRAGTPHRGLTLRTDDSWTDAYFVVGSLEERDRLSFGAPV